MPRNSLRRAFRTAIIGLASLAIPLTAVLPANAATVSPAPQAAVSSAQHLARALVANYPDAFDTKTQYLTSKPTQDMPNSCVGRDIGLAAGPYTWDYVVGSLDIDSSASGLYISNAGTYSWETCIYTQNGYYQMVSSLTSYQKDNQGDPVEFHDLFDFTLYINSSGEYTWGSVLKPGF